MPIELLIGPMLSDFAFVYKVYKDTLLNTNK